MIPKKHKDILKSVVEENGFDKGFAEDAVSFFWSEVRKNLSDLSYHTISVSRFGLFTIKYWKIDEFIESYAKFLEKAETMSFKEMRYKVAMEKQYNSFLEMKKKYDAEMGRKEDKKKIRQEYEHTKTMGEQIQDNGGSPEQCNQEG